MSVIIPTYNREAYLREAVASVLAQTYGEWELLVLDDGSTDGTRAYLESITDPRVRPRLRSHSGNAARLRNEGARAARGSYLAFLDSDDVWLEEKLALQVADVLAHPECGWSYTGRICIDERGRHLARLDRPPPRHRGWILEDVLELRARFPTAAVLVERRLFEAIGGFDEALLRCQDTDLRIKLAEASPAAVVPAALVKIRVHAEARAFHQLDVLRYMHRIYGGLLARTRSPRIRRLGRRQRVRVSLEIAGGCRRAAQYADARRALAMALPYAWWRPAWWIALGKTVVRPWVPAPLLARYARAAPGGESLTA